MVIFPRLHTNDGPCKVGEVIQSASHRTEDAGHSLLASHACIDTGFGPTTGTTAESVDATPRSRDTDGARNIRPNTNATTHGQKRTLSPGRTTRGVSRNMGVQTVTPESIGRLE